MNLEQLLNALGNDGLDAGITIAAQLEPLGGRGTPVKPAVYAGNRYQLDRRWWGDRDEPVTTVSIDNPPSQANRMEPALLHAAAELGLPVLELDLTGIDGIPPHVPTKLTSFDLPHRQADSYLRDAVLVDTGEPFLKSAIGEALVSATPTEPNGILQWMPHALIFGFWQSHLGKKRAQTKFARAVESEIVGYEPGSVETRRYGIKGDPLNLSTDLAAVFNPDAIDDWDLTDVAKAGKSKAGDSLAELGHGQVPIKADDAPMAAISFRAIEQLTTISFARLRNVVAGDPDQSAAARALLAALALVAIEGAFSGGFTLRSGCTLRPSLRTFSWVGSAAAEDIDAVGREGAIALCNEAGAHAASLGLPVGPAWDTNPVRLVPNAALAKAIRSTFGLTAP